MPAGSTGPPGRVDCARNDCGQCKAEKKNIHGLQKLCIKTAFEHHAIKNLFFFVFLIQKELGLHCMNKCLPGIVKKKVRPKILIFSLIVSPREFFLCNTNWTYFVYNDITPACFQLANLPGLNPSNRIRLPGLCNDPE